MIGDCNSKITSVGGPPAGLTAIAVALAVLTALTLSRAVLGPPSWLPDGNRQFSYETASDRKRKLGNQVRET